MAIGQTIALEADLIIVADAADATAALALAAQVNPSVALVDILLPDQVTGLALVRSLVQRPGCAVVASGGEQFVKWSPVISPVKIETDSLA